MPGQFPRGQEEEKGKRGLTNSTSLTIHAEVATLELFDRLFDPAGKEKREVSISRAVGV